MPEANAQLAVAPQATVMHNGRIIHNPDITPFVERNEFMRSLEGLSATVNPVPLEEAVLKAWKEAKVSENTARLARDYTRYAKQGARLPKFSRWASGMFSSDQVLSSELASIGQVKAQVGEMRFSTKLIDILRAGATPHFGSCFNVGGIGDKSLLAIAANAPGIGIVYADAADGCMRGRFWLYHARRLSDGKDIVVMPSYAYGNLTIGQVAKALKDGGFIPYKVHTYDGAKEPIEYVDVGTKFYNDTDLWQKVSYASPL